MPADQFSKDVPELLNSHLNHLLASAISLEHIKARGYKSILGNYELEKAGFSKSQRRRFGILIPLHGVDGNIVGYQYRPDCPREDATRKRKIKYENPRGASVRLDVPPLVLPQIGDPGREIWFTEGVKKADALATAGVCAVCLTGIWGFKGKNILGGTTVLADFDYIALKDRQCYLVFDSDYTTNPMVRQALDRLSEHLKRKGGHVHILQLPAGKDDTKTGADDYLAQGHTLEEMRATEINVRNATPPQSYQSSTPKYIITDGHIAWIKQDEHGEREIDLCNFNAWISDVIEKDNGIEVEKKFIIKGTDSHGFALPDVGVSASEFMSMNWVTAEWDTRAIIAPEQMAAKRLATAILIRGQDAHRRTVYTHTGWRNVDGKMVFLTAGGAIGGDCIEVELEDGLARYWLPAPNTDPTEAIKASYEYLSIGRLDVTLPIWAAMFLAPLSEILDPAFTIFVVGQSGSFKSTITALALNHFGPGFDEYHLPAAWRDTENKLEKMLFLTKDLPLVIDDWAPGADSAKAREMEVKAEHIIRAQGNRQGKGRLRSDTSSRTSYVPRGLLITSGEQLPSGHSHTARIFSVEINPGDLDRVKLSEAQKHKGLYCQCMSHYILWLKEQWPRLKKDLPGIFEIRRDQAREQPSHPRLPSAVAWLYIGFSAALDFMAAKGVLEEELVTEMAGKGWEILLRLASEQSELVEEERPAKRFVEALASLINQGRAVFANKEDMEPPKAIPGQTVVGWYDTDGHYLLEPNAAYNAVHEFYSRGSIPFTVKPQAVWRDLRMLGYTDTDSERYTKAVWIRGVTMRIIKLKKAILWSE